ncbi:hypothetical protein BN1047_01176 [Mycolicibacterium neoaurum]|uniref:Uncharacterized protein n=1 Tax=Mycolicibacterium neoaurum TaxID=1795 RepID=A0AAV2WGE5_MYCNE|nr:hypothetical protein BN1047_01176 [Mycolicibacterium neoaurum]
MASGAARNPTAAHGVANIRTRVSAKVSATRPENSRRVRASPRRTARVIFPDSVSVGMSRRLLATNTAEDSDPTPTASATPTQSTRNAWVYWVPSTATSPKNTKTATSPRPR